jgi:hypothetical protein
MGKRTKEHRKKVAVRNQRLVNERRVFDKQMDESVKKYIEDLKEKMEQSGQTENSVGLQAQ